MDNSVSNEIVEHNFEQKKQQLRTFANDIPNNEALPIVEGGEHWFGVTVKATGDDLNNLSQRVGDSLIEQNKSIVDIRKEFISIYDTFEALDKDYIQNILVNLKATNEANKKAFQALEGVEKNNRQLEKDQTDLKNIIDTQKSSVKVLLSFKERLDKIDHIVDVDVLFSEVNRINKKIVSFEEGIEHSNKSISDLFDTHRKESDERITNLIHTVRENDDHMQLVNQSMYKLSQQIKITRIYAAGFFVVLLVLISLISIGIL